MNSFCFLPAQLLSLCSDFPLLFSAFRLLLSGFCLLDSAFCFLPCLYSERGTAPPGSAILQVL